MSLHFTLLGRYLKYITIQNIYEFCNHRIISDEIISNLKANEFSFEKNKREYNNKIK
jgi:hypothetical protein